MQTETWLIPSSEPGKTYSVTYKDDGRITCECPHWFHRLRKTKTKCKHIEEADRRRAVRDYFNGLSPDVWHVDFTTDLVPQVQEEELA